MSLSQDERIGKLTTPLGGDVLALSRFDGGEHLSEPFEFRIEAISEQENVDFGGALGKNSTVKLKTADGKDRYFNGVLVEARWAGARGDLFIYQLVLRPWLWLLSLTSDCRIFAQKSPKDIIKQVFSDRGFSDFRDELKSSYPTLEYCVQYRETDFDFVSRLMEQYGIYYFFEYSDGTHTLVLADMKASHKPVPDLQSVPFVSVSEAGRRELQHLEVWSRGRSVESGVFKLNDYDYNKPPKNLLANSEKPGGYAHDSMEMYDYIGEYSELDIGNKLAQVEAEAAQSLDDRRTGTGSALSLLPGGLVTLQDHNVGAENQEYLVVACSHFFQAQQYRSGGGSGGASYAGNFEFTPSSRQFRAELDTERPCISGYQSALVVGKQGEEIDVDDQGRITVQFYWDRKKKPSRRVRVAQLWAGKTRGNWFVPRIGDEVLIHYEEGDPDRPIVVGSVYNDDNKLKLTMPGKKTESGLLTKSSKNSDGYNMLLFDDTASSEKVKLRAQKDLMFKAINNEQRDIGGNQTENVTGNETINVGIPPSSASMAACSVGGNFTLNAAQTATINVGPILPGGSMPVVMTQIVMTNENITLNVGPEGVFSQIIMSPTGITLNYGPAGAIVQVMIGPAGIDVVSVGPINFVAPVVNIPVAIIGTGMASGLPLV
jgi:type VI secretion system secreted protein VgrG